VAATDGGGQRAVGAARTELVVVLDSSAEVVQLSLHGAEEVSQARLDRAGHLSGGEDLSYRHKYIRCLAHKRHWGLNKNQANKQQKWHAVLLTSDEGLCRGG
jgi:hypothetical protein